MKFFKILLLLLFFVPLPSQAVGISVTPSAIDLLYPDIVEKKITIKNISTEPIIIYVYADDFSSNINIEPAEFELLPDQISRVNIAGDFSDFESGIQKTNISVLSKAKDKKSFNAISGVKIPISVYINKSYFTWSGSAVFVVVFFVLFIIWGLIYLFINIFSKKPKKHSKELINLLIHYKKKRWYKWW
ncbi:MAG: hypothetical protein WCS88_00635 [Patescibacteria group bacterium]|jgi:hypothetical protein